MSFIKDHLIILSVFTVFLLYSLHNVESSDQGEAVNNWAQEFGTELYDLGLAITKGSEIKSRYSVLNAQVERKDPKQLLAEIVENISRMMDRKMDAIKCIIKVAEDAAEVFEYDANETEYYYYNTKYSPVDNKSVKIPPALQPNARMYLPMFLNNDTHFYNVAVNTSYSSVHVPVNIYDRHKEAQIAIQWSEALDQVFRQNYNSDPALSWQYFGSSSGIMRHYPAMKWITKDKEIDTFDCRIRNWFIEAATCTKDVIILVDSSGSMQGMRKHIATYTVSRILDTFSNNDYINVLNYSMSVNYTVACFEDMLVQATRENVETFKKAVQALDPDNKSNVTDAFAEAFSLLERYRVKRGCGENSSECSQAIMLVTDGISGNISHIFDKYNRANNGSNKPVRIFTYLIGAEVLNVNEIMWAACVNRGYYSHVQSLEEVTGSVFKYISVIARPLVLHGNHSVTWTHAYADITYDDEKDVVFNEPYRLLISAAVPAFDRRQNQNNESRTANLLGVAGTDVPIDDIRKLTMPYKIGVMAYSFLVSNNGYVLMHPSLRPVFKNKILKENYNSIDFAEVEQHHDKLQPRELNPVVLQLRELLVNGVDGSIHNAKLKYHYDNLRRIAKQAYDYYFTPLANTPFSIGLAVPEKFGNYSILVGDEIQKIRHTGANLTSLFEGSNWKIHPKWVYCKYHYLEGHEFNTPEEELLHFLNRMYNYGFKWERQYEAKVTSKHQQYENLEVEDKEEIECGRKTLSDNDYYCDRDLVQRLIFDAKNTLPAFKNPWRFYNNREQILFETYNATLRYVATMSGLTRWEYIFGEEENVVKTEFGDLHSRAIDETWYKSAVLQHQYDKEAFVYSVPFDAGDQPDILVTSSYAIFPKDAGIEAPGSVVGFQFSHSHMHQRFVEITSKHLPNALTCEELYDCYVVDNSGYVIISYNLNDTGRFFGEIQPKIMKSFLSMKIFEEIIIYDFQALCEIHEEIQSRGGYLQTPLQIGTNIINYVLSNLMWILYETNIAQLWNINWVSADEILYSTEIPVLENDDKVQDDDEEEDEEEVIEEEEKRYYPCDLKRHLYVLDQNKLIKGNGFNNDIIGNGTYKYYLKRIPFSNLILVSVMHFESHSEEDYFTTDPQDVEYNVEHPCQKISLTTLPRRRLTECFNEHPLESEILACGRSSTVIIGFLPLALTFFVVVRL